MRLVEAQEIFMNCKLHFKLLSLLLLIQDLNIQVLRGIVTFCSVSNGDLVDKLINGVFIDLFHGVGPRVLFNFACIPLVDS